MLIFLGKTDMTEGNRKNHDSHRRDRILRLFLCLEIGQFSPHFGAISLLIYTVNLEKSEKKSTGENSKKSVETAPRNCRFLSLVVVERVLNLRGGVWGVRIFR